MIIARLVLLALLYEVLIRSRLAALVTLLRRVSRNVSLRDGDPRWTSTP